MILKDSETWSKLKIFIFCIFKRVYKGIFLKCVNQKFCKAYKMI